MSSYSEFQADNGLGQHPIYFFIEPIAKVPISPLPPGGGGLGWGEGCIKSSCYNFTHPLTPSREGRGDHILKSFAIGSIDFISVCPYSLGQF